MLDNLVCPISNVRIDRNVVRVNGLITTGLLVAYVFTRSPWLAVPIALDFVLRARMSGPTSPMTHVAGLVARALRLPPRAMDKAPKVFASRLGLCLAMGAAITHFVAPAAAPWLAGTLAIFAGLESVFDLCVACVIYTYVALPLYRARDAAKSIPLFSALEEPMLDSVAEGFQAVDVAAGEVIVTEGEPGNEMFVIQSGEVEVYHEGGDGGRRVFATYKARDYFGEMALLSGKPRVASVRARTKVSVLRLRRSDFDGLLEKYPGMAAILERTAVERMAREADATSI